MKKCMRKHFPRTVLGLVMLAVMSAPAFAVSIVGTISVSGSGSATGGTGLATATAIDFNPQSVSVNAGQATDDFSGITSLTMSDFTFSPFVSPTQLWVSVGGSTIFTFVMDTLAIDLQTASVLALSGSGTASATGFDDTNGTWSVTGNSAGTTFSWSSSTAVPVPAAFWLFGSAVVGLAAVSRRRTTTKRAAAV